MDRKSVPGVLLGLLAGAALGYWWRGEPPSPPLVSAEAKPAPIKRSLPKSVQPASFVTPPEHIQQAELLPVGSYEHALRMVADYAGEGFVRCDVEGALPDGPIAGLRHAQIEGGFLVGAVEEPRGQARIGLPGDPPNASPRLIVRWSAAWPGETGHCQVLPPERITVSGRVVDAQGHGIAAEVGNAVEGTTRTAPDGSFTVQCWLGADCPIAARRALGQPWGPFETLVLDGPEEGLVLQIDASPQRDMKTFLEEQVAEDERLAQQPDPLALALSDPTLSEEAKALVTAWLQEQTEARSIAKTLLADISGDAIGR